MPELPLNDRAERRDEKRSFLVRPLERIVGRRSTATRNKPGQKSLSCVTAPPWTQYPSLPEMPPLPIRRALNCGPADRRVRPRGTGPNS